MKAATGALPEIITAIVISIHAAREGGDYANSVTAVGLDGFQSTPPVKAATAVNWDVNHWCLFQSTPPVKAAT